MSIQSCHILCSELHQLPRDLYLIIEKGWLKLFLWSILHNNFEKLPVNVESAKHHVGVVSKAEHGAVGRWGSMGPHACPRW